MRKFLSSLMLMLFVAISGVRAAEPVVSEAGMGTCTLEYMSNYKSQGTFIKLIYSEYLENKKADYEAQWKLLEEGVEIETATGFGFDMNVTWTYSIMFNKVLDPTKNYQVIVPQGAYYLVDEDDNVIQVTPEKTLDIPATETGGGQGGGSQATPWDFTSVTPADGATVASLKKIVVKAEGLDLTSVTSMVSAKIKCNETGVETSAFFSSSWDSDDALEATIVEIKTAGTYTLTIAEGAVKVNNNPNNAFTATWTVGEVAPTKTTTTLSLDKTTATLDIDEDVTLTATSNVQALINWESSDINVAIVNEQGRVIAKGAGTCTITASIPENDDHTAASATCEVTVNAPAPTGPFASITIGSDVIELSEKEAIELYEYPAGAVIKINLSDAAILGAWYEIKDLTTDEVYKSFAEMQKGEGYYSCEMPRTYGMVAGHNYAIHAWFKNKASQLSGQILYEYNFLVKGTNNDVPVLSTVSEYESVSPTEDFVLTGVTGTNTIDVRFKGEAPASATAWATVGQGSRQNLTTTIDGNTVHVTVPNSAIAQGVLVLFVQAKDSEGHVIGGGDQSVNPDNGALSWSWLSEVGCEMPQMLEANTTVDELKTVTFKASAVLSLDEGQLIKVGEDEYIRRYNQLQVMDKLGNVIVASVEASQYAESGNNMTLTLKEGIVEAGEYTIVLPYGAFLIGEEMQAASNASGTYVVTVSGNLEPQEEDILGEAIIEVTESEITISFPNANIPAGITDGEVALPGGVIINIPDGDESTEAYGYPDAVIIPTSDVISFTFDNPKGLGAIVTIPAEGIQVIDYTDDYFGKVIYTNSEDITNATTAISAISADKAISASAFNLAGQRINANAKGIVIVAGKKMINK